MEFTEKMHYVGKRSFKSKEGKQFNMVSFASCDSKTGAGSVAEMFINEMPKLCEELHFLDLVECTLELESMGSKPRLLSIDRLITAYSAPASKLGKLPL